MAGKQHFANLCDLCTTALCVRSQQLCARVRDPRATICAPRASNCVKMVEFHLLVSTISLGVGWKGVLVTFAIYHGQCSLLTFCASYEENA